ncbi:MAG: DUF362 domain-containing protein [Syntrophaceae bacterium]
METARVFFSAHIDQAAIRELFEASLADLPSSITSTDHTALKVHFGEEGNTRYVPPAHIQPVISTLKGHTPHIFLTDANTLYRGMRYNATDHRKIAQAHGFEGLETPIVIADGEHGDEEELVPIPGRIFREVKIARAIAQADAIVLISHFKGHVMFGFGGSIKNLGMGSGSRAGKMQMHSTIHPAVIAVNCTGCGACAENCANRAISLVGDVPVIDAALCTGCAKCIAVCEFGAIDVPWGGATSRDVMARTAEYALGAGLGKKIVCLTFITNITKDCDCMPDTRLIGQDVGLVAGIDPVACDQAAYDLVLQAHGNEDIFQKATRITGTYQIEHAAAIGLGTRAYHLETIPTES